MKDITLSRITGSLLGQAIGDALGSQTEFRSHVTATDLMPTWGYPYPAFSDDTQMALAIAEAFLIQKPIDGDEKSIDRFMSEVSINFRHWLIGRWGKNDRSPGGTCMSGTGRLNREGTNWRDTGSTHSGKGNGGPMRSSPVGMALYTAPEFAFKIGALTSVPTHNNIEAQIASASVAFLVATSISGYGFSSAVGSLFELLGSWDKIIHPYTRSSEKTDWAIARFASAFAYGKAQLDSKIFHKINTNTSPNGIKGSDFKSIEAVASAIFHNAKYSNYEDIVFSTANTTGDSDTTSAIAGAIIGARVGDSKIKKDWRDRVETSDYLHDLAYSLYMLNEVPVTESEKELEISQ